MAQAVTGSPASRAIKGMGARVISELFTRLYEPEGEGAPPPPEPVAAAIVAQFNRYYYSRPEIPWKHTTYRGVPVQKAPTDLWIYQEIISELRPAWIIETGTLHGGSGYYLADLCTLVDAGQVISIDVEHREGRPVHPRLHYLTGSSADPATVERVRAMVDAEPVMVILDSDHSEKHVRAELSAYSPMVSIGSFLVVEDTICNGNPALPNYGPGPMEALQDFLANTDDFVVDQTKDKFMLTFNPKGYLRRVR